MIPKIIHYCWLSNDPIPSNIQHYMDSWKKYLPDYEFIHWNFDKFDKSELFKKYSELIQAKDQFIGSLQQAYLNPRLVDADKAIAFYYEILNMNHDLRDIPKWDGSDINNFIFANDNKIVQKENELIVDELHVKTLSVREYPEELGYLMLLGMPVML